MILILIAIQRGILWGEERENDEHRSSGDGSKGKNDKQLNWR